jgi:hypothetical protein
MNEKAVRKLGTFQTVSTADTSAARSVQFSNSSVNICDTYMLTQPSRYQLQCRQALRQRTCAQRSSTDVTNIA